MTTRDTGRHVVCTVFEVIVAPIVRYVDITEYPVILPKLLIEDEG